MSFHAFIGALALALSALCGASALALSAEPAESSEVQALKLKQATLNYEVDVLNKNKKCDGDGECEAIEFGVNPCGGPSGFLLTSRANSNGSTIVSKLAELGKIEEKLNSLQSHSLAKCPAPRRPDPRCIDNVCRDGGRNKRKNPYLGN